jgi:hypothetical protein
VRLRVWPRSRGRDHAYALPKSAQWAANEELRSGGQGSPWQRFP